MSSDSESTSFTIYREVLTKIFLPLGHVGLISNTQHDVTRRFGREIRIPFLTVK